MRFSVVSVLVFLLPLLSPVLAAETAAPTAAVFVDPSSSSTGAVADSDPNRVKTDVQQGLPDFTWQGAVTTTNAGGATTTPNGLDGQNYMLQFETLSAAPSVGFVDLHYYAPSLTEHAVASRRMVNGTRFLFNYGPIVVGNSETLQFNYTYMSLTTGTAQETYTFEYTPSTKSIKQITTVIVAQAAGTVLSEVQTDSDPYVQWQAGVQKFSNLPNSLDIIFVSKDKAVTSDWVDVHYIISSDAGLDGALKNYRMTRNTSVTADNSVTFYWRVDDVQASDRVKMNYTYLTSDNTAVDTIAFLYTPSLQKINTINNIADSNVIGSTDSTTGVYLSSTGVSGGNTITNSNTTTTTPGGPTTPIKRPNSGALGAASVSGAAMVATMLAAVMALAL